MSNVLDLLDCRFSNEMKQDLDHDFTPLEVKQALDQMSLGKSPRWPLSYLL